VSQNEVGAPKGGAARPGVSGEIGSSRSSRDPEVKPPRRQARPRLRERQAAYLARLAGNSPKRKISLAPVKQQPPDDDGGQP
jgi:hypothetical protein